MLTDFSALVVWFVGLQHHQHVDKRMVDRLSRFAIANRLYENDYLGKVKPRIPLFNLQSSKTVLFFTLTFGEFFVSAPLCLNI
jgi:hypothetical protein